LKKELKRSGQGLESVWAEDRPPTPPPVFYCAVCPNPLLDDVSVAIVIDSPSGGQRFTVHKNGSCDAIGRAVVTDIDDDIGLF